METKCFRVPIDIESRTEFRILEQAIADKTRAAALVLFLWRELAYAAAQGRLGFLPEQNIPLFPIAPASCDPIAILSRPGCFLKAESGGYHCALFEAENRQLEQGYIPVHKQGGHARGVVMFRKRIEGASVQQALLLDKEYFKCPDGQPMAPDESSRCMMLIKLLDNYMSRPARLNSEFSAGLVMDAWRAQDKCSEDEINRLCTWLSAHRGMNHPGLPANTETLLRNFGQFVAASGA